MSFRYLLVPALACGIIAAPLAAEASARMPSPAFEAEALGGESLLPVLASLGAFAAVVLAVALDGEDEPVSP